MQAASNQTASWRNKSTHLQELGHNRRNREGGEPGSINAKGGGRHLKGGSMEPSGRGGGEQTHRDDGKNDTCSAAASSRPRDSEWQHHTSAAQQSIDAPQLTGRISPASSKALSR